MADRKESGLTDKEAHILIDQHGEAIAQLPGGKTFLGFGSGGPVKGSVAAQAQSHLGDVDKSTTFSKIQKDVKKN